MDSAALSVEHLFVLVICTIMKRLHWILLAVCDERDLISSVNTLGPRLYDVKVPITPRSYMYSKKL